MGNHRFAGNKNELAKIQPIYQKCNQDFRHRAAMKLFERSLELLQILSHCPFEQATHVQEHAAVGLSRPRDLSSRSPTPTTRETTSVETGPKR